MDVPGSGGETTHFSLVDGQGMVVAVTQSLNGYYGAKVAHPTLGVLYNDYMRELEVDRPGDPFALRPDALPYSSMSATILLHEGRPSLAVGSPGSKRIISAVVQVVSHWVDVGRGIRTAVEAPRLHVVPEDDLFMEARGVPAAHLLELERRGYSIVRPLSSLHKGDLNPFFGGVHAVAWEGREWTGAADPRRDGAVDAAHAD
jgi:gamma-glutamyltranspeptidase/glutathione hydrolase